MRVPLFPLNLVLFPGQTLPLHIVEERYKQMLQRCLAEQAPFGIVLIRDSGRFGRGSPHGVGTLAHVTRVEEVAEGSCPMPAPHRGNCYHIMCRGGERFRVSAIDRREADYLMADIELFPDEPAPAPAMMMVAQRVSSLFDEYYRSIVSLMGGWQRETPPGEQTLLFDIHTLVTSQQEMGIEAGEGRSARVIPVPCLPTEPAALSNVVAMELNVQPSVKQDLLETPSALARLQREAEILAEETPQIQERLKLQYRRLFSAFGRSS